MKKHQLKTTVSLLIALLLFSCDTLFGQNDEYRYRRELYDIRNQWHSLLLPDDIFGKISQSMNDIRIIGYTPQQDTIEVPYVLRLAAKKVKTHNVDFKIFNESHNDKGYYYTFELEPNVSVNKIVLTFEQENFDWRVYLEGSNNQNQWFSVLDDYRIVSIKNTLTDYEFTTLTFPNAQYRYFRLFVKSNEKPNLMKAGIIREESTEGKSKIYTPTHMNSTIQKKTKQSVIDIRLSTVVPIWNLNVIIQDTIDYYRHATVQYLSDSIKTAHGWEYVFSYLTSGTLSSFEKNEFTFNSTNIQNIRIIVDNQDNAPLKVTGVQVKGYIHELVFRFSEKATYFLIYGNSNSVKPHYDIEYFSDKIPANLTELRLGEEQSRIQNTDEPMSPLFENKIWLWVILSVVIVVLGWFTLSMIKKA